ncbi:glycosyltransferase [Lachnospiraceae bacterium OttesenSCG-928-D06]|nr:glycosyltransferase [Lachnospiraceae bacterium OttesenSCG-928-D06]
MKMKKISVIIPCYNSEAYIHECFESLKNQTIGIDNLELIFINDASTDNTLDILNSFEKEYPYSIVVIDLEENIRQGGARNVGLQYITGEYVSFLDSDDLYLTNALENLYEKAIRYDVDVLQFNHYNFGDGVRKLVDNCKKEGFYILESEEERRHFLMESLLNCGCWNKIYRKSFIQKVAAKFAEKMIFEEPPFVYPHFFYAERIYITIDALYMCRRRCGSTMCSTVREEGRIMDHPRAQMVLLCDLMSRRGIMEKYRDIISQYFIWTYYVETITISGRSGMQIDKDIFKEMQNIVTSLFPDYKTNPLINYVDSKIMIVLESLEKTYSQRELNDMCRKVAKIIWW